MTKIDIISGFLGAGKTTFIKKMLDEVFKGEKVVLIENEFGEVGIDGGFLKDAGIEISEMNQGCICCSLVGDFDKNLREVIDRFTPDRILIEPSGVGKLSDVMTSVTKLEDTLDVKLNGLVTVVNAPKALKQMKAFGEFFNNQIEFASTIVLSRTQGMDEAKLEDVVKHLQEHNDKAAIITTPWDKIKGDQILKAMEGQDNLTSAMKELAEEAHEEHEHHHHHEHGEDCTCGCHDHEIMNMNTIMNIITTMSMTTSTSMNTTMSTIMITNTIMNMNMNTTTSMNTTASIITIMALTAHVDVMTMIMTMIIITITMRMKCLQAGARKHLISLKRA